MTSRPTEIKRLANKMVVQWNDGHCSEYSYPLLRQKCPCARCKAQESNEMPARSFFEKLNLVDIQPVGRYAVRLIWNDGHKTGIYPFEFLRSLDASPGE